MKVQVQIVTALMLIAFASVVPTAEAKDIQELAMDVNGTNVGTELAMQGVPYIDQNGQLMVPLRLADMYTGYESHWDGKNNIHLVNKDAKIDMDIQIGSREYVENGKTKNFNSAPFIHYDRTYLTVQDFEKLHRSIRWDKAQNTVYVYPAADYDSTYQISGQNLTRVTDGKEEKINLPKDISLSTSDEIQSQKVIGKTTYLAIAPDDATEWNVYRDDGSTLSYIAAIPATASYFVKDNKLYYSGGTREEYTKLYVKNLENEKSAESYNLLYSLHSCVMMEKDDQIVAVDPEEQDHLIEPLDKSDVSK
ncbi:MAG: copper amine oxidase N-terminal domain-containing protein [Peptococcaceae bacterium]|nr:copper amine oxidase N-terminal domain-containing protein [Peptococcaceae bacterium]